MKITQSNRNGVKAIWQADTISAVTSVTKATYRFRLQKKMITNRKEKSRGGNFFLSGGKQFISMISRRFCLTALKFKLKEIGSSVRCEGKIKVSGTKNIKIGDYVLTRKGYKKVIDSRCTGLKKVNKYKITNKYLTCTSNHNVITSLETKAIQSLTPCDILYKIKTCKEIKQRIRLMKSFIGVLYSDGIRMEKAKRLENIMCVIPTILKKALDIYIDINTNVKKGIFQKAIMFIIKMGIISIMRLKILRQYLNMNIYLIIRKIIIKIIKKRYYKTLIRLERKHPSGIVLKKELNGIESMQKNLSSDFFEIIEYADIVEKNTLQKYIIKDIAQISARPQIEEKKALIILKRLVRCAEYILKTTSIQNENIVVKNVEKKQKVYNLTIEDEHEYFANGILVKNCDCLRYIIAELDLVGTLKPSEVSVGDLGL